MNKIPIRRSSDCSFNTHKTMSSQRRKPHFRRQNRPISKPSLLPHQRKTKLRFAATSPMSSSIIWSQFQ
ncbi:GSCOCG00001350001-RA-CDS, partial [Cotesia congregata]